MYKRLAKFCRQPKLAREETVNIDFERVAGGRALVNLVNIVIEDSAVTSSLRQLKAEDQIEII